ncbi:MAG: hypothetical protein WEG40_13895 [Candidatus Rokuibacteriota bacterium]
MTGGGRTTRARAVLPALAMLVAAGGMAGLLAGLAPSGGVVGELPDAAEIPTDGRRVEALGPAPLGALGAALQLVVVLACPAICLAMGVLRRFEGCGPAPAPDLERGSGQGHG